MDGCGQNSNSSKNLWLSKLPASLITIWSKIRVLWCPQQFRCSRASNSKANSPIWPKIELVRDLCVSRYLHVWRRSNQKWRHYHVHNVFPIISLWLVLPWKPVLIQSAPKPYAAHPNDVSYIIWSKLANWPQRYSSLKVWRTAGQLALAIFKFESVDNNELWRLLDVGHYYIISSPCKPTAQVS